MPVKIKPAHNVMEQAELIASDAWDKTEKTAVKGVKAVAKDVASQASFAKWLGLPELPSDEQLKMQEEEEFMRKLTGYKEIFRKIDAIEGRATDENALDEKARKYVMEEREKLAKSYNEMKIGLKTEAEQLGAPPQGQQQEAQEEQEKKAEEEQNDERKKEEERASLETTIEAPHGREAGPGPFTGKRRRSPTRLGRTPSSTLKHRTSAEARLGHGIGG